MKMSQKAKKFISPRMEIIDHFDEVINDLDIYTEVLLDEMEKRDGDKEIYTPQYFNIKKQKIEYVIRWLQNFDTDDHIGEYDNQLVEDVPKPMAIKDYVNLVRAKSIVELKKVRDEILAQYDVNASRLKRDWSKMENVEERERLREDLFGKQFCFSLQINAHEREYPEIVMDFLMRRQSQKLLPKPIFKFCIIFVDFYLSEMEIVKLRKLVNNVNGEFEDETKLNEKTLLMNQIDKYVWGQLDLANFGNEVIRIQKSQLLSIEKVNIKAKCDESNESFYVSRVKSLGLKGGHFFNLSVFPNLRHLYWTTTDESEVKFECTNFNTLQTLQIKLRNFPGLNNIFDNLLNLEYLYLDVDSFNFPSEKLQLNHLLNLKYLSFCCNTLYCSLTIKNLKNLKFVYLVGCNLDYDCFDGLNNLEFLFICYVKNLSFQNFKCLHKLNSLYVYQTDLSKLDLSIQNVFLSNLKHLSLYNNKIEVLKEGTFSRLKSLTSLDLSENQLRKLYKNVFSGLDNLKHLYLNGNPLDDVEATLTDLKQINDFISVQFH